MLSKRGGGILSTSYTHLDINLYSLIPVSLKHSPCNQSNKVFVRLLNEKTLYVQLVPGRQCLIIVSVQCAWAISLLNDVMLMMRRGWRFCDRGSNNNISIDELYKLRQTNWNEEYRFLILLCTEVVMCVQKIWFFNIPFDFFEVPSSFSFATKKKNSLVAIFTFLNFIKCVYVVIMFSIFSPQMTCR